MYSIPRVVTTQPASAQNRVLTGDCFDKQQGTDKPETPSISTPPQGPPSGGPPPSRSPDLEDYNLALSHGRLVTARAPVPPVGGIDY